jgi:hypothetical protein
LWTVWSVEVRVLSGASGTGLGKFGDFHGAPVLDARGEVIRTPIRTCLSEIDWHATRREGPLSALHQRALTALLDDHEATWIVAAEVEMPDDRTGVEAARESYRGNGS